MPFRDLLELTRQEFYKAVWSMPMSELARDFGVSDVALAKWCRKLDIPRPGRGYWQRKAAGKRTFQPPLPYPERLEKVRIRVTIYTTEEKAAMTSKREKPEYELFEQRPENEIVVGDRLRQPHPLVKAAREALKDGDEDLHKYRWVSPTVRPCLDVRVSRPTIARALRIMDALLKALEKRGIPVEVREAERWKSEMVATVQNEEVHFDMFESPHKVLRKNRWSDEMEYGMEPSGRLVLRIGEGYSGSFEIRDGHKKKTVEMRLNEFVVGLHRKAEGTKEDRAEHERRQREYEEEQRTKAEIRRKQELFTKRIKQLDDLTNQWRRADEVRTFLTAIREKVEATGQTELPSDFVEWLSWATAQSERLDPLSERAWPDFLQSVAPPEPLD